jgi:hypothetical protein
LWGQRLHIKNLEASAFLHTQRGLMGIRRIYAVSKGNYSLPLGHSRAIISF